MKTIATLPVLCCGPDTPPIGEAESESLAARFKALADPTRVAIVNRLAAVEECCVCDLNAAFDLSQPTIRIRNDERECGHRRIGSREECLRPGRRSQPQYARRYEESSDDVDRVAVERRAENRGSSAAGREVHRGDCVWKACHRGEDE